MRRGKLRAGVVAIAGNLALKADGTVWTWGGSNPEQVPGLSGIECVRYLKPHLPATHFVMLTVYDDANNIFEALAAGAVGYLLKRAAPTELIPALREVLAGGSPMTSSVARQVVRSFHPALPSGT